MKSTEFIFSTHEQETMRNLSVAALILFGSRAQEIANDMSDYDIGVLVSDTSLLYNTDKRREIYDALYDILSRHIRKLVDIDIVFLETAPSELQAHAMKHGKVIFESKKAVFAHFKERVMVQYADFAPLREIFHRGILEQIS